MKDHDQSQESLYLMYWDFNNLYDCAPTQKLHRDDFEWRNVYIQ